MSNDSIHTLRVFAEQEGLEYPLVSDFWPHGEAAAPTASSTRRRAARCAAPSSSTRRASCAGLVVNELPDARDLNEYVKALETL
ncbi:Alkyl hydroperoxide reductase C OS=Streptomyces alboniger OX=132473 GN=CP975_10630 PE=4 SV=1 [Streptomyces alboniger]